MGSHRLALFGALATVILLAGSLASAGRGNNGERDEATALAGAKVSLLQATTAAEQHVQGKAIRAELEDENGALVYGVEVARGDKTMDVKVDSLSGKVLSVQADRDGASGEHEGESEREE
ncbi:MAG: PepSY domain-containing protein [Deltaproteobacteria bacterium]|nr:PepSY domain-containing protein [Deltaproteobacteria bacterium]